MATTPQPFQQANQADQADQRDLSASPASLLERLREVFLFRNWTEDDLAALARLCRIERHRKGHLLFFQGQTADHLHILLRGRVQMYRTTLDGREVTLHVIGPGGLVGCAALFLDRSFPAHARIISADAELLVVQGPGFLKLLAERPDLSRKMIGVLSGRLSELADRLESRQADSALMRLAGWLLEHPSRSGEGMQRIVRLEGNKKSLAASLGMTPETLSRCLRRLTEQGLLDVRHKEIILRDPARLLGLVEQE